MAKPELISRSEFSSSSSRSLCFSLSLSRLALGESEIYRLILPLLGSHRSMRLPRLRGIAEDLETSARPSSID
jgi:hypothetical protein